MSDRLGSLDLADTDQIASGHPAVAVDVVIFTLLDNDLRVLLVRRGNSPFRGMWAIPGGFVQIRESLEAAALRTLEENIDRDPRVRVISVTYFALVQPDKLQPRPGVDTTEASWHSMYHLPELAFDHATILTYALERLRYKLEYSAVAFELMPEEFTLRELQEAYMVILNDHTLDKANFRKKLRYEPPIVEPTGESRKTKGRPAALYRFREDAKREVKARRLFP
jgi:8-oxo-dGTP diphosphatase